MPSMVPTNFLWGTATASYQVEGAIAEAGRGQSIWDSYSHTPGMVKQGHTGDVACDQFHRYAQDVALMKGLNVGAYRFSIAWPRIFPQEDGRLNPQGFDYYKRLLDELQRSGIEPWITLYHWDLPLRLQERGGWPLRDTAYRFRDYAVVCFETLGDRVDHWITLNEPFCSSLLGYLWGVHAPGIRDRQQAYSAIHHLLLGHGLAVEAWQSMRRPGGQIGIALNMGTPRPATRRPEDVAAADRATDLPTRMFLDPILGRGYPERHLNAYPDVSMPIEDGDLPTIAQPIDFVGLNFYWEDVIRHDSDHPEGFAIEPQQGPKTDFDWPITPRGLERHLLWINRHIGGTMPLYITENGCAMPDRIDEEQNDDQDGAPRRDAKQRKRCRDPRRIAYLREHVRACADAMAQGVPLRGYFHWSLIDNFEWSEGYTKRFGLVYCDYATQRRIPKDSYYYYRDVIAGYEPTGV